MDPAVFSHPSLAGDLQVYRFQKPIEVQARPDATRRKWERRTESFEKLEVRLLRFNSSSPSIGTDDIVFVQLFGKSLLRLTLTELVTNHHASLTVPAVEVSLSDLSLSPSPAPILTELLH